MQAWFVQGTGEFQVPEALQVSTPLLVAEHRVAPGAQLPVHAPLTQAWFVQGTGEFQIPEALQVSTPLPVAEHRVAPGAQTPVHAPPTQAWFVQETGEPQAPEASHVWTPLPEHLRSPGVQVPRNRRLSIRYVPDADTGTLRMMVKVRSLYPDRCRPVTSALVSGKLRLSQVASGLPVNSICVRN
jgi:hypothetical protein